MILTSVCLFHLCAQLILPSQLIHDLSLALNPAPNLAPKPYLFSAALWKLPIIFVVENNLWAIGMNHYRATSVPEIWKKGEPFGMPGVHVDGMDVLKVRGSKSAAAFRVLWIEKFKI